MGSNEATPSPEGRATRSKGVAFGTSVLAGGVGWLIAHYFGGSLLLIPGSVALVASAVLPRVLHGNRKLFYPAVALQIAQLAWMTAGCIVARQVLPFAEVVVVATLLGFLVWKPNRVSVAALGAYQVLVLVINTLQLVHGGLATWPAKAIQLHILIRVGILVGLGHGLWKLETGTVPDDQPLLADGGGEVQAVKAPLTGDRPAEDG